MVSSSESERSTVLLDTNTLIYSASRPFDLAHQLRTLGFTRILVPSSVIKELQAISEGRPKKLGKFARLALTISASFEAIDLEKANSVDDEIFRAAKSCGYVVATSDRAMRRRLRTAGVTVLYLKEGHLINEGDL